MVFLLSKTTGTDLMVFLLSKTMGTDLMVFLLSMPPLYMLCFDVSKL